MVHGPERPVFIPKPGYKSKRSLGQPAPVAEPTSQFLDETGAVVLGLEWHSDLMLLEDSQ